VRGKLTDVLLAQGYQDLSGQIIRGVMKLVDELELALNTLVRIGNLQALPARKEPGTSPQGHGPVVPGVAHGHTVSGQQDVDAMLSGLGM
jgi:chemotaxis protein CheZ